MEEGSSTLATSLPDWSDTTPESTEVVASIRRSCHGVLKESPVLGTYGVGLIKADGSEEELSFHVRELENGGEDCLVPGVRVTFGRKNGRATNVLLIDVRSFAGIVKYYSEEVRSGFIVEDGDQQEIKMNFEDIFKKVPETIVHGMRVNFTVHDREGAVTAKNIRFPDLKPCSGTIVKAIGSDVGGGLIRPDHGAGTRKVWFNSPAVTNREDMALMKRGTKVTYELERKFRKHLQSNSSSQLHATNVCLVSASLEVIQPVEHTEAAASQVPSEIALVRLTFSRDPAQLHELLQALVLPGVGTARRLQCGAYVFAQPDMDAPIEAKSQDLKLGCTDVIVTEALEKSVKEAVFRLPRKYKISIETRPLGMDLGSAQEGEDLSDDQKHDMRIHVKRTFIHVDVPSSMRSAPSSGPRTASTTDVGGRANNPRGRVKSSRQVQFAS